MKQICSLILFSILLLASCSKTNLLIADSQLDLIAGNEFSSIRNSEVVILNHPQELSDLLNNNTKNYRSVIISAPYSFEQIRIAEKWPDANLFQIGSVASGAAQTLNFIPDRVTGYGLIADEVNEIYTSGKVLFVESSNRSEEYIRFKENFLRQNSEDNLLYIEHQNFRETVSELNEWDDVTVVVVAGKYNYDDIRWIIEAEKKLFVEELRGWKDREKNLYSLYVDWEQIFKQINESIKNKPEDIENSQIILVPSKLINFD